MSDIVNPEDLVREQDTDAYKWARAFMGRIELGYFSRNDIDESLMVTWFANAMMVMHDKLKNEGKQ